MLGQKNENTNTSIDQSVSQQGAGIDQTPSLWISKRFLVAVVIFLCYINTVIILTNMNITIVEMTSAKLITKGNLTIVRPAEFEWDPSDVGIISSIISYGGLFSLGGDIFVNRLGGSLSCVLFTMLCGISNLFLPVVLYTNFSLFIVLRLLSGFFANCFYVSTAEIFSRWFPKRERSTLICFCVNGSNVGGTIVSPLFGYIADRLGWKMVFYVSGTISLVVSLLCLIIVKNRPTQDAWISEKELSYILYETKETSHQKIPHRRHPYKDIFLSPAVWSLCTADFTVLWIGNIAAACSPLYAKDMTGKSTDEIGFILAIPNCFTLIAYPVSGLLMDYWRNHSGIDRTQIDKTLIACASLFISILFAACAIFSNFTISVVFFTLIMVAGLSFSIVFEPNIVNIAPNDSSVVAALTKVCSSASTILNRTLTGFMTVNHTSQEWNNCFLLSSGIALVGAGIFTKYGSSEAKSWSVTSNTEDNEYDQLIKTKNGDVRA